MIKTGRMRLQNSRQSPGLDELAREAVRGWDLPDEVSIELINVSENATYKIVAADGRCWALRLHHRGSHTGNAIRSELFWLTDLRRSGVVTAPMPVAARNGELVRMVWHPSSRCQRHAVLFRWERGVEPRPEGCLENLFGDLGEVTARMHLHVRRWRRPACFERLTWDVETMVGERPHWGRWQDGIAVDDKKKVLFGETVEIIQRRLRAFGRERDRFGLVHGDLRLANLLVDGASVKVLDFDDCGFSWFMYDAATPVSFFEDRADVPELVDRWLEGYRRVIDLPQADADEIPTFIVLRRLLLIAWIGSHSETELARDMGAEYTERSGGLFRDYIRRFKSRPAPGPLRTGES